MEDKVKNKKYFRIKKKWSIQKKIGNRTIPLKKNFDLVSREIKLKNFTLENKTIFSISDFRYKIEISIIHWSKDDIILKAKGMELCFGNALRRILLSEIATVTIEKVFFYKNTSILNDEIVSHRLGLIPIFVNVDLINFLTIAKNKKKLTIILKLEANHPNDSFGNIAVFSNSLLQKNTGILNSWMKNSPIKPAFKDILVAKLNPGQKIIAECHCVLGTGNIHAKFSPVGTSFYKIFPRIKIISEILDKHAHVIRQKCPVKVFDIEDVNSNFGKKLKVSQPHFCTLCRECLHFPDNVNSKIRIGRSNSKISFIIESTGVSSPEILFHRAIYLLVGKCNRSLHALYQNFHKI
ncbi:DNA-directed RNA polymerase 40k chain (nucleomorph) [Chroomonas mesostigmatica CCMP1168]|uniref:DNA-directed RNA polymerase 40k chain n=1 Tax=Chroomonas mesostigmatica CCMP1168 TaxID=1195612 RepID=J7G2H0_9CRYP|nr:DNA-directed RNA polymerase 40k chain [Chroomonas mesostigmatica CCMP1168]